MPTEVICSWRPFARYIVYTGTNRIFNFLIISPGTNLLRKPNVVLMIG